jgi:hypothetical protein
MGITIRLEVKEDNTKEEENKSINGISHFLSKKAEFSLFSNVEGMFSEELLGKTFSF